MLLVEHKVYGKGKIQEKRFRGFELYVEFEDGISRWVRHEDCRFLSETSVLTKHEIPKPVLSEGQFKARQIIEALRLGVVPYEYVEEITIGRNREISQIKSWLNNSKDGCLIILGEYGVGKTHLLEYLYSSSLRDNWAVSIVELDPNEAPFHKPKTIYEKIICSFKFKTQNGDFREFLREIARSPIAYELERHKYLSVIIEKIQNGTDSDDIWEWIEGRGYYYYPRMYDWSTCGNIYCYILSGIGWAAKNILGLNGFLILFDEAESVDSYWYSSYQNNKGWNFLRGLILMANNKIELLRENIEDYIGPFFYGEGYPQRNRCSLGYYGSETDLQYCGRYRIRYLWKEPCCVKIIFAFTPDFQILEKEPLNTIEKIELGHLNHENLVNISEIITALYNQAYSIQMNTNNLKNIPADKTRIFIKGVVESLDLVRFHPDKPIEELLLR